MKEMSPIDTLDSCISFVRKITKKSKCTDSAYICALLKKVFEAAELKDVEVKQCQKKYFDRVYDYLIIKLDDYEVTYKVNF